VPFAGYKDFADCVAKNQDKDDPQAYCGSIKHKVEKMNRHWDFERIYNEFCSIYPDLNEATNLYNEWLGVMQLDETLEYGQARESYLWKREDLQFVKEDALNKYYEVEVGFPTKSMNGNVYKKRDLIAASLTLKGKHPSLNHKDEFWFSPQNPRNRWGTIDIIEGRFHEGISKALIKVPKDMICPICNGKKMTELIDSRRIVNVSLEGDCKGGICPTTGECEGFFYTDPPFTLLTTSVLPGIPMTRIKPLESYMPLRSSNKRGKRTEKLKKTKRIKIVPKLKEDKEPGQMGKQQPPNLDTSVYTDVGQGQNLGPSGLTRFRGNLVGVSQQTEVARGTDPAASKPEGVWKTNQTEPVDVYPTEGATGTPLHIKPSDQPDTLAAGEPMPEVDSHIGPDKVSPPPTHLVMPEGDTTMHPTAPGEIEPKPAHDCPAGHHWTDEAGCVPDVDEPTADVLEQEECPEGQHKNEAGDCIDDVVTQEQDEEPCADGYHRNDEGDCVPDTNAEETVKRIKAEYEARGLRKNLEYIESIWVDKYTKLKEQYQRVVNAGFKKDAVTKELRRSTKALECKLDSLRDKMGKDTQDLRIELQDYKGRYGSATREQQKTLKLLEDVQIELAGWQKKYHRISEQALILSRKNTEANEDYLEIAKQLEHAKDKLQEARKHAKKTIKLKL